MTIKLFQIDAFADRLFAGNPAAVCLLEKWLSDSQMQSIAAENNLAETAFIIPEEGGFGIRWFTPKVEVRLCGHATLASAHALIEHCGVTEPEIVFHSHLSGKLLVRKSDDSYILNFPSDSCTGVDLPQEILACVNHAPVECYRGQSDFMMVFDSQSQIESIEPKFHLLEKIDARALIVTAPGADCDFVSRFFAPQVGINEDPVTGSAHTTLIPYWSKRLDKTELVAKQLSRRGGAISCKHLGERVEIGGQAQTYLIGEIVAGNL